MSSNYSIEKIFKLHRASCPDSQISKRSIKMAVADGTLPSIVVGNRNLINIETFEKWLKGELLNG